MIRNAELNNILQSGKPGSKASVDQSNLLDSLMGAEGKVSAEETEFFKLLNANQLNANESVEELPQLSTNSNTGMKNVFDKPEIDVSEFENLQIPNTESDSPEIQKILKNASRQVQHNYQQAKLKNSELNQIFQGGPEVKSETIDPVDTQSVQDIMVPKHSDIFNKSVPKETFYKEAKPFEYKSMFSTPKTEAVKAETAIGENQIVDPQEIVQTNDFENIFKRSNSLNQNKAVKNYLVNRSNENILSPVNAEEPIQKFSQQSHKNFFENMAVSKEPSLVDKHEVAELELADKPAFISEVKTSTANMPVFNMSATASPIITNNDSAPKVLELDKVDFTKQEEVINKISDYIVQNKVAARPTVDLVVRHEELGNIGIHVEKALNNSFHISINAHSVEGRNFFSQNQSELLSSLNHAGLKVGELKLESHSSFSKQSQDGSFSESGKQSFQQQFSSHDGQRRHESQRRQELWSHYKQQQEVA